jgi:predicted secreted hydrolase
MSKQLLLAFFGLFIACNLVSAQELQRAQAGYQWSFPRDHGAHQDFQSEWWYYTGQLFSKDTKIFSDKPSYGFQLTFFRRAEIKSGKIVNEFMAHAALTDINNNTTYFSHRLGGGALGLAGVSPNSLSASSGDWSIDALKNRLFMRFSVRGPDNKAPIEIRVLSQELLKHWFQGADGVSRKANCDGCASMYYSMPRIMIDATVQKQEGLTEELNGLVWMDHEFMTNSLSKDQVGWDWFGLNLKDGRSLMLFRLRNDRGESDFSSGGITGGVNNRALTEKDFEITPIKRWRSDRDSGVEYPVEWRIVVPSEGIDTVVKARVNQCEIGSETEEKDRGPGAARYWEGPVASEDESILGYLEMTGYAGKIGL